MHWIKEPLILYGEGNYALTAIKEIDATEGFLNLGEEIIDCQNIETYLECQTRDYMQMGLEECKCTPYELRNFSKEVSRYVIMPILSNFYRNKFATHMADHAGNL